MLQRLLAAVSRHASSLRARKTLSRAGKRTLRCEFLEERQLLSATPSNHEQYLLEMVNRGRADPAAEAARYGIALNEGLAAGTISTAPKQPLAFHPSLVDSAHTHSQWMIDTDTFSHTGAGGTSPGQRMTNAGYAFSGSWTWAENIAWSGQTGSVPDTTTSLTTLHRNLFVDSNVSGRGHRVNLMNPTLREIGTGVTTGVYKGYNAVMLTQDFAKSGTSVYLTGVAYDDARVLDNDFYTPGEGLSGVTITATRTSDNATFDTTTWSSGGYSLALPAGSYTVIASGIAMGSSLTVPGVTIGTSNVKIDFIPDGSGEIEPDPTPVVQAPGGTGTNNLTARRNGENLQVVTSAGLVLFNEPLSTLQSLTIRGADNKADNLTVDVAVGGELVLPVLFDGGSGTATDTLVLLGSAQADRFVMESGSVSLNDLEIGFQGAEQIRLQGGNGGDGYVFESIAVPTTLVDTGGTDTLNFSTVASAISIDLSKASAQPQQVLAGQGTLALSGTFENAIGSSWDDVIRGNSSANRILGRNGNDTIYGGYGNDLIYGEAGNDRLHGEAGNDMLVGSIGNDELTETSGRNLLIGGAGTDNLKGSGGEEVLIGGSTTCDTNDTALRALLAEWMSSRSFATRINNLTNGGGSNGTYRLIPGQTVVDDLLADTLFGGSGSDWFLTFALDSPQDRTTIDR